MKREVALARLRPLEQRLRQRGVSALYLFGSVARDEATETSDVDLAFDLPPGSTFDLFDQAGVHMALRQALGTEVELISHRAMPAAFKARVAPEMIRVF